LQLIKVKVTLAYWHGSIDFYEIQVQGVLSNCLCALECEYFETDVRKTRTFSDEISNTMRESVLRCYHRMCQVKVSLTYCTEGL
jgi:hypothetical protein